MKPYIFITRKLPDHAIRLLKEKYEISMWESEEVPVPKDRLYEEAGRADALLAMLSDRIDEGVLSAGSRLKIVANLAVGYDNIDIEAATKNGVAITNTPDVLTDTTADLTFALLMAAARRIVESAELIKEDKWTGWSPLLMAGHDIHHKTIGIVGMGKIGSAVAKRAAGFDMNILYHNRNRKPGAEKNTGAKYAEFGELLAESDFIVCLAPLTSETKNLFNRDVFRKMKKTAIFINAARGAVVDEQALYEALAEGDIAGAGLDVFIKEPIGADHPLLQLKNVTAIPHIGSASIETRTSMIKLCEENIDLALSGKMPKTLVNKEWKQV